VLTTTRLWNGSATPREGSASIIAAFIVSPLPAPSLFLPARVRQCRQSDLNDTCGAKRACVVCILHFRFSLGLLSWASAQVGCRAPLASWVWGSWLFWVLGSGLCLFLFASSSLQMLTTLQPCRQESDWVQIVSAKAKNITASSSPSPSSPCMSIIIIFHLQSPFHHTQFGYGSKAPWAKMANGYGWRWWWWWWWWW